MEKIPDGIRTLIQKLYPNNRYTGIYDSKPDWIDFPYEKIVQNISDIIKQKCGIERIKKRWDRNRKSSFDLIFSLSKPEPNLNNNMPEMVKLINKKKSSIFLIGISISILGPYASIGLVEYFLTGKKRISTRFLSEPPTQEYKILYNRVIKILKDNKIHILSEELLKTPILGMTGSPDHSDPLVLPNVYNCLFGEGVGTGTKRNNNV